MRIGYALSAAGRAPGGVRRYAEALAEAMAALPPARGAWRVVPGAPPARVVLAKYRHAWRTRRLDVDLLHVPNTYAPWFATPFRKIVTVHDLTPLLFPWSHTFRNVWHHRLMLPRILAAADHVIAVSAATKRDLVSVTGMAGDRVTVVHEAPHGAVRGAPRDADRPGRHILFVGANEPRKNLPGLLAAYRVMRRRHRVRLPLVVAGPPGWKNRGVREDGDGVVWKGYVPDAELAALYSEAALLIYPSFYEGFGLPVLEAMAAGTPVLISDRGALPEVAGDAAVYADPARPAEIAAAAAAILADGDLWDRLSRRGTARAARFTWEAAARRTWAVYERVMGKAAPRAADLGPWPPARRAGADSGHGAPAAVAEAP